MSGFVNLPLLLIVLFPLASKSQVIPSSFSFATDVVVSVNGSSAVGLCSNVTTSGEDSTCTTPTTSVLFDGNIPTLTALDGNVWASQLLALSIQNPAQITFNFTATPDYSGVRQVEVMMFNCPEWGIAVQNIRLLIPPSASRRIISASDTSCESLVRVCESIEIDEDVLALQFIPVTGFNWIHLAEVTFYGSGATCEADTTTTPPPATMEDSTTTSSATGPAATATDATANSTATGPTAAVITTDSATVNATCSLLLLVACLLAILT